MSKEVVVYEVVKKAGESSNAAAMDVDGAAPPAKRRRIVNENGQEITTGGLEKPIRNADDNLNMRYLLFHIHEYVGFLFGFKEADWKLFDESLKITSFVWTAYTLLKQEANNSGNVKSKVTDDTDCSCIGKKIKFGHIRAAVREICGLYGLRFDATPAMRDLRGIFQVNLSLMYTFKYRACEGVYLNATYKTSVGKDGVDVERLLNSWGATHDHLPFSYGANFPPALQASSMQQMGAAPLLIGLCETLNSSFQAKWEKAVVAQMSGVPNIASIARVLKGSRSQYPSLVCGVLDIVALGTAKQTHKAAFPWCFLRATFQTGPLMTWAQAFKVILTDGGVFNYDIGTPLTETQIPKYVGEMDFSGKGMWNVYNKVAQVDDFQVKCVDGASLAVYAQWLSYTVTGLWMEDTAVLRHVFGTDPILRKDYGQAFVKRRSTGKLQKIKLLPAQYVCKLATAAQTKLGATDPYVGIRCPSVSGRATTKWDADDARNVFLERGANQVGITSTQPSVLQDALDAHKKVMLAKIRRDGKVDYGTTAWFKVDETSGMDAYGTEDPIVVQLDNKYIFSQN